MKAKGGLQIPWRYRSIIGICEPPYVSTKNQALVLYKNSTKALTAESSLQPLLPAFNE